MKKSIYAVAQLPYAPYLHCYQPNLPCNKLQGDKLCYEMTSQVGEGLEVGYSPADIALWCTQLLLPASILPRFTLTDNNNGQLLPFFKSSVVKAALQVLGCSSDAQQN